MTRPAPIDPESIRRLPTSGLAIELLRHLVKSQDFSASNLFAALSGAYVDADAASLLERLSDAWAWLVAHGLLGPSPGQTSGSWMRVTQAGRRALEEEGLAAVLAEHRLAEGLAPELAAARLNYDLQQYELAAFAAMKEVEVAVRRAAGADAGLVGVALMRQAFKPDGGALVDVQAERGEQGAIMDLFAGAIGTFKNPASHRTVHYDDPLEAAEILQLADLLLRILRRSVLARQ